jgi:hypothetical protein
VDMDARFLVRADGNVANERGNFDLLVHGNRAVLLRLPIKISEFGTAQRADGRDLGPSDALLRGKLLQRTHNLVAGLEDDGERSLAIVWRSSATNGSSSTIKIDLCAKTDWRLRVACLLPVSCSTSLSKAMLSLEERSIMTSHRDFYQSGKALSDKGLG